MPYTLRRALYQSAASLGKASQVGSTTHGLLKLTHSPLRNKLQSVYPDIFLKVRRNKSHIPLKYRCHPQLFHTGDNAPSHLGHFIYLLLAQRTTVAFQVSHIPPGGKCRIRG